FWSYDLGRSSFSAFKAADGSWGRVSQLYRETAGDRLVEHEILLRDGRLVHGVGVYDENENPLEPWHTQAELPATFLEACIALADFDAARFPVYAAEEYAGQWPPRAFIAECAQELLPGYAFAGGSVQDGMLQLLMDDPQGARVFAAAGESGVIISAPLPADTVYGVENFTSSLGIGGLCVTMGRYDAGRGACGLCSRLRESC
ncbi:MAG: hypothetical protein Q4A66_13480, partial [Eubacteriales bacterium]|nr:hypothetical protein [Eubacteriales bacterium]